MVTILEVETEERDGLVRIALRGELDLSTVRQVEEALTRAETGNPELIVIDLGSLSFLDSTGLRMIVSADQRARDQGRRVAIVRGPDSVDRVFTITKLGERLEIVDDISAIA